MQISKWETSDNPLNKALWSMGMFFGIVGYLVYTFTIQVFCTLVTVCVYWVFICAAIFAELAFRLNRLLLGWHEHKVDIRLKAQLLTIYDYPVFRLNYTTEKVEDQSNG